MGNDKNKEKEELDAIRRAAIEREEQEKMKLAAAQRLSDEELKAKVPSEEGQSDKNTFMPVVEGRNAHWQQIVADYRKTFNKEPSESGSLVFDSHQSAIDFFSAQAKMGRSFMAAEYVNGQPSGFHVFSCGDNNLYKGTLKEIQQQLLKITQVDPKNSKALQGLEEINSRLEQAASAAVKSEIREDPSPTNIRDQLRKQKEGALQETAPQVDEVSTESTKQTLR